MRMLEKYITPIYSFAVFMTGRKDIERESFNSFAGLLFICSLIFYGHILVTPLTGFDDYTYFLAGGYGDKLFGIVRGIWMFALENQLLPFLSISPYFSSLVFVFLVALSTVLIMTLWCEGRVFSGYDKIVGLLILIFPYWTAQAYFPYFHYGYGLCNLLPVCTVALAWHSEKLLRCALALVLLVVGTAHYQGAINMVACVGVATTTLFWIRAAREGTPVYHVGIKAARCLAVIALASLTYLVLHKIVLAVYGLTPEQGGGYSMVLNSDIIQRLWNFKLALFGSPFLLPPAVNAVYLVLLALVALLVLCDSVRLRNAMILLALPMLGIAIFSPVVLALVQPIALFPRAMTGVAFLWALAFLLADMLSHKRLRGLLCLTAVGVTLFFFIRVNYAWHIQNLTVERDKITAAQINERLGMLRAAEGLPSPLSVSVIGCIPPEKQPWPTDYQTMFGHSQLVCFGDRVFNLHASALLQSAGGEVALIPLREHDWERVKARAPWPAQESVFVDEYGAALWLGGPRATTPRAMSPELAALAEAFGIVDETGQDRPIAARRRGDQWLYNLAAAGEGPWAPPVPLRDAIGHIDSQTALPGDGRFLKISGWAFDLKDKQLPDRVVLLDANGQIIGFAVTGIKRQALVRAICPDAIYAGFTGYMLTGRTVAAFRYPR